MIDEEIVARIKQLSQTILENCDDFEKSEILSALVFVYYTVATKHGLPLSEIKKLLERTATFMEEQDVFSASDFS